MHFEGDKTSTRFLEQNILNLAYEQFEGVGKYDIPELYPVHIDNLKNIPLQGFNFALKEQHPENIGVHFFLHDYQFERVWKYPDRYIDVLKKFAFVLSPQFSAYNDMPLATKIYNKYRNHWCGRYWQEHDIKVIPSIVFGDDLEFDWCLDGIPKNSTIAISTIGDGRWGNYRGIRNFYERIVETLEPDCVLLYGKNISKELNLSGNIVFKQMISSKVAI